MNPCTWAAEILSKDEGDFKRAIQKLVVWKIETIFETVQTPISTLKHRDHEKHGLGEEVDWTSGHRRNYSLPDHRIAAQFSSHMFFFSDSDQCLVGKREDHLEASKTWENDRIREFVQGPEYRPYPLSVSRQDHFHVHVQ